VAIKADKNLQTVSGIGGTGATLLENRAAGGDLTSIVQKDLEDGVALGSGVLIKASAAGIAMLGNYLYGAGYATQGESPDGVNRNAVGCDIMFDSGARTTLLTGANGAMRYGSSLALTMIDDVTGMYMRTGSLITTTPGTHVINAPIVHFDKGTGRVETPELTQTGIRKIKNSVPSRAPNIQMEGNLFIRENLGVLGGVISESSVVANDGCNPIRLVGNDRLTLNLIDSVPERIREAIQPVNQITESVLQAAVATGVMTEYGQKITDFSFPSSESLLYQATKFQLVAPRWQTILDSDVVWEEKPVAHGIVKEGSLPYPGRAAFERTDTILSFKKTGGETFIGLAALSNVQQISPAASLGKFTTGLQNYIINRER
jgi:hypothetical protein